MAKHFTSHSNRSAASSSGVDGEAVKYYREHRRSVEALITSGCVSRPVRTAPADLTRFLSSEDLHEIEERTESFNLFAALGVAEAEIRHSRLLAWLLNPSGSHGLGTKYLKSFLELVCAEDGDELADYALDLRNFEVHCEHERMDLVLINRTGNFVCAIENKVRTDQGDRQLERYRQSFEAAHKDWACKFVFLTLKGEKPDDTSYIAIQYEHVLHAVIGAASTFEPEQGTAARTLLFANYAEIIRKDGENLNPTNIMEILHLTRHELKHSHFLAWLLDPAGSHGLEDAFARYLFCLLERKGSILPQPAAALNLEDVVVRKEHEDIDILFLSERHRLVLAIENKFDAVESPEQLAKYHKFLHRHYAGDCFVHVFLDLKSRRPSHENYVALNYRDLLPFFDSLPQANAAQNDMESVVKTYVQHYAELLANHLWVKRKTKWFLPAGIQECCDRVGATHPDDAGTLINDVTAWQKSLGRGLENFFYEVADRCFGPSFKFSHDVWFTFIPPELDQIAILREGGADPALPGRMAFYQFFVVPFGDAVSVRKAGIFLDVKLIAARREYEGIKQQLHDAALKNPIFNRVKNGSKLAKFDILLNYEICSFEEVVSCDESELRRRISNQVERFSKSIHPEIVSFFTKELSSCGQKPVKST